MTLPSQQQIQNLPTLLDIVQMYHKEIQDHVNDGLWNGIYVGGKDVAWNLPSGEFCNNVTLLIACLTMASSKEK